MPLLPRDLGCSDLHGGRGVSTCPADHCFRRLRKAPCLCLALPHNMSITLRSFRGKLCPQEGRPAAGNGPSLRFHPRNEGSPLLPSSESSLERRVPDTPALASFRNHGGCCVLNPVWEKERQKPV